eukprot:g13243.t1 g13243   contig8:240664-242395(+)
MTSSSDTDHNNDDDDEEIDPNSLGDWRQFRMNLANSGFSSPSSTSFDDDATSNSSISSVMSIDGINLGDDNTSFSSSRTTSSLEKEGEGSSSSSSMKTSRPKSVSKRNEELLRGQNVALAEEYLNGVWAHESAVPEVGGLVCRMPLEAEIYRGDSSSRMHKKLQQLLESDEYDRLEDVPSTSLKSSPSTGGASTSSLKAQSTASDDPEEEVSFSALAAKTVFWYRGAEKLLKRELGRITMGANENGKIEVDRLGGDSLELLQLYMDHQQTWQEVCLVVEKDDRKGTAKTITINRPMAFKLSKSMGRLVLLGAYQATQVENGIVERKEQSGYETQNLVKFLVAFENQCGVYVGGPDKMDEPATLIHGIADLPGSVEISPGTGIYEGGLEAAMDGVLSGKYKPLDFRFFIGHTSYEGGELDYACEVGKYQPVACSRPLVLKQCMQLPKPLWHEVLEFCGGELKEISKLELMKREDLQ